MPLETLFDLVEKLRERIQRHGPDLRKSEMLTRYALVDPLLRELGGETEDRNQRKGRRTRGQVVPPRRGRPIRSARRMGPFRHL